MRLLNVVGARPQFVKLAPVCRAIAAYNARRPLQPIENVIVHTGQHYDPGLSDVFFDELEIPRPDHSLGVGSGSHGQQTARMLEAIEALLLERRPDAVVVYGDTNSTLAAALAAVKLHVPVVHIEAGLRSFNRQMPEEINRIATDHVSDLLLAPTPTAVRNLHDENLGPRTRLSGDVMLDAVQFNRDLAMRRSRVLGELQVEPGTYAVATVHRAENTSGPRLKSIVSALEQVARRHFPVIVPLHPRTRKLLATELVGWVPPQELRLIEPLGYLDMLRLVSEATMILTDSGGLQKEAFFLNRPCVTLRDETEWVETVEGGGNVVSGIEPEAVLEGVAEWLRRLNFARPNFEAGVTAGFGGVDSAGRTIGAIVEFLENR